MHSFKKRLNILFLSQNRITTKSNSESTCSQNNNKKKKNLLWINLNKTWTYCKIILPYRQGYSL